MKSSMVAAVDNNQLLQWTHLTTTTVIGRFDHVMARYSVSEGMPYFPFASGDQVALSQNRCPMQLTSQMLLHHSPPAPLHSSPSTQSPVCVATLLEPGGVRIRRGERRRR